MLDASNHTEFNQSIFHTETLIPVPLNKFVAILRKAATLDAIHALILLESGESGGDRYMDVSSIKCLLGIVPRKEIDNANKEEDK